MLRRAALSPTSRLAFLLAAAPAAAAAAPTHYRAEPLAAPSEARIVARDVVFRCSRSGCLAPRGSGRAEHVCAALVGEVGALSAFSAAGRPFDTAALETCNRRAR